MPDQLIKPRIIQVKMLRIIRDEDIIRAETGNDPKIRGGYRYKEMDVNISYTKRSNLGSTDAHSHVFLRVFLIAMNINDDEL